MRRSQLLWVSVATLCLVVQLSILNFPGLVSQAFSFPLRQGTDNVLRLAPVKGVETVKPLDRLTLMGTQGKTVSVRDSMGHEYAHVPASPVVTFTVGGALGTHSFIVLNDKGQEVNRLTFQVDAHTKLNDGGHFGELFNLLHQGMLVYSPDGTGSITWNGKTYRYFVPWVLDNFQTLQGMQYFNPHGADLVDLFRQTQRADGMIWSFVAQDEGPEYFDTAYGKYGYVRRDGKILFVRQPAENHVEYLYVNLIYQCWKASGDDQWMTKSLDSAMRALDYSTNDRSRWSTKFGLLKRAYTVDSWDFQIEDKYLPDLGIGGNALIDPDRTKFGIFYGDNTGYAQACEHLAEMLNRTGSTKEAEKYRSRAQEIRKRLNLLAWNGRFFTHHIEEDPNVKRDLGVNEKSQVSLSNMYSLNRNISHEQSVAIVKTYLDLKDHLPLGSPGEWYAIYPPFERGFGKDTQKQKWQYMNGGVAGHAAGELARGAFEQGFEGYGSDILSRLLDLGKKYGHIWFAYTGAIPPPPPAPNFTPVNISKQANMDIWGIGGAGVLSWMGTKELGNDMRGLPVGDQMFAGIRFKVIDPASNGRRSAIGVSAREGFPQQIEVPVNASAGAVYLLHTASDTGSENVAGAVTFRYADGSEKTQYVINGKHVTGWWFPSLHTPDAGVAWHGPNLRSASVGMSWMALDNPQPEKRIRSLVFSGPLDGGVYAVSAITLADKSHYVPPNPVSYGGPDNWASSTAMAGLLEGLAGVTDADVAYRQVRLSPRWISADVKSVDVTVRYAASKGYVSYNFEHSPAKRKIALTITGSGERVNCHVLLPENVRVQSVMAGNHKVAFQTSQIEGSRYVDFTIALPSTDTVVVQY